MSIDEKISKINTAIEHQIGRLEINLPQETIKLWRKDINGRCVFRPQMNKERALIDLNKKWIVADDSKDFQVAHILEEGSNIFDFVTQSNSYNSFEFSVCLVCLSKKTMAFPLIFEALKSVGNVKVKRIEEDYEKVTREYFATTKNWGVNPDYRGMILTYTIALPRIEFNPKIID